MMAALDRQAAKDSLFELSQNAGYVTGRGQPDHDV